MVSKVKQAFLLSIYFLSPIIASIIYWFEEPLDGNDLQINLIHRVGSILGIFSFIWMCFIIIITTKIKLIETNFSLGEIMKLSTLMSTIALFFGTVHYPLVRLGRTYSQIQIRSGTIGWSIFLFMMLLAIIFMSNLLLKFEIIKRLRLFASEKKFRYNVHKVLHNLMMIGVLVIFIHTLISFTSEGSLLMRGMYSFFFAITFIGWVYHKLIRRFRSESDPYVYRRASWDVIVSDIIHERNPSWALNLLKENPSIYPCLQCGSCTAACSVSEFSKGDFNPREIIENALLGLKDKTFIDKKPNVWDCTLCYSCDEICPQHVRLTEIFLFLKNKFAEQKEAPEEFLSEAEVVYNFGVSIPLQSAINRRREKLELPTSPKYDIQEIRDIMDMTGFNKLVEKPKVEQKKVEM